MDNPSPIYYRDLITPDDSITKLISQLDMLIGKYDEAKSKIQSAAQEAAKAMNNLSGATEDQREQIKLTTEQSEKLVAEYRDVSSAQWKVTQAFVEAKNAKKEGAQIDKLVTQINTSLEGSYNRLSAMYRLNKIRLNEMSEAQRKGTEAGRKLEAETKAIYEEMNRLQKATGKSQLQVGQYERALGGALGVNSRFLSVLTDTSKVTETFKGALATLATPIGIAIGAVAALVGAFKLFKESIHSTQATGDAFDVAMGGWTATWEVFKKSVSTVDFSGFIQQAANAAAAGRNLKIVLDEMFERTTSTRLLRASMSEENALLEERARDTRLSYEEREKAAKQYLANMQPVYDAEVESAKRVRDAQLTYLFDVTNKRQFASEEAKAAAREEFAENIKNYVINEDLIKRANEYNQALENREHLYDNITSASKATYENIAKREKQYTDTINAASDEVKSFAAFAKQYSLTSDTEVKAYADAEEALQRARSANYNDQKRMVTLANNLEKQRDEEQKRRAATAAQNAEKRKREEEQAVAQAKAEQERAAREAEQARAKEIADQRAYLQFQIQQTQLQIAITEGGTEEMLNLRIEALKRQRELELFENRQKAENIRQDEAAINAKYDRMILKETATFNNQLAERDMTAARKLSQAEFNLLDKNERQKTIFRLEQERKRLEDVLKLNETATEKMTADEVAAVKKTIEGINKERERLGYDNIYELLGIGLDSNQQDALNTAISSVKDSLSSLIDSYSATADAARESADARVEAAQKALDAEMEARKQGYANDVATAQAELALAKKTQEQATADQKKAQKAQAAIDALTQSSSLVTATANIWKALSGIPVAGPGLAVAAIATMWGTFLASKIRAAQVTKEEYGEGTVELLQGGSHASGNDIDLGTKPDGTRRRAEGGEYFAVINKRSSKRYGKLIPDVITAFNDGTFADKYQRANALMSAIAVNTGTDVGGIERDVAAIRRQGDESRFVDARGREVIRYKNLERRISR